MSSAGFVLRLPRGGVIVQTSAGRVQLGVPPETIKDAMEAGIDVPQTFVMPSTWFSRKRGFTVAELEFPVYYNWFVRQRRLTAVCDEEGRRRLRIILRESLFGPQNPDTSLDYEPSVPQRNRADLLLESRWFRRRDGDPQQEIKLDDVLGFALYDEQGRARLGEKVVIERIPAGDDTLFRVLDGGRLLLEITDSALATPHAEGERPVPQSFKVPAFGMTVLGSSHGFDVSGKTTGFVLWINRHGVLVDPPIDCTATLAAAGVSPNKVDSVILTHCHADHDSGVLQKILEAGRVNLYTTPTILGSFLRKVGALTGEAEDRLRRLFIFRPVTIGAAQRIQGAEFHFFYTFHPIPTIGFECFYGGKSFAYSADTFYEPKRIEELHQEGLMTSERRDGLLAFPFNNSLVVHEAGVPPIHTPATLLAELPAEVKARMRIIHIAERDLPAGSGLKLARTGFEETVTLPVDAHPYAEALETLDALAAIDLLRNFNVERCREFLTVARRQRFAAGSLVVGQGERGDSFYIIMTGEAAVVKDGVIIKSYRGGDFFGEAALVTGAPRSADVRAKTDLEVVSIDKYDFLSLLRGTDLVQALVRLAKNRDLPSWALIGENAVLGELAAGQRTNLQALLEPCSFAAGFTLWRAGDRAESAWLIGDAAVEVREDGQPPTALGRAALLCDIEAILRKKPLGADAVVTRAGTGFRIAGEQMGEMATRMPGLLLALSGARFVS